MMIMNFSIEREHVKLKLQLIVKKQTKIIQNDERIRIDICLFRAITLRGKGGEYVEQFIRRILVYTLGLWVLAFGVAISVNSNLGVSPVNSLPYVVSLITGKELGTCVIMIFLIYIAVQIVILRKEFQWFNLAQILCSTVFGYFVDLSKWILGDFALPTYAGRMVMLAVSIVLVSIGIFLYLSVDLLNMPMEGMTKAMTRKIFKKMQFHQVKVLTDCTVVGLGIVLSFVFMGEVQGIREGTVLSALLVGKVMKQLQKWWLPGIERFCYGSQQGVTQVNE